MNMAREIAPVLTRGRKLALLVTALVYLGGAAAVYWFIDDDAVSRARSLPILVIGALLALSMVNYAVRTWRWLVLSDFLGLQIPVRNNAIYYLSGYALTATPGKAGEAVRLWLLRSGHGVPYARSVPIMIADRVIDTWAILLLVLGCMGGFAAYRWQGVLLACIVLVVSIPIVFPASLNPFIALAYRLAPGRARLVVRGRQLVRAMRSLLSLRTYGLTLLRTVVGWLAEGAALYLILQHFEANVSLPNAVFVFTFSMLVGAISMIPGGLGSTEATMVLLLSALGVPLDQALAATAIIRITTFWFAVVIGLLCTPSAMSLARRAAA